VEKLRGLGNTRGQILEFPIEMAGHPYNSAALPCSLWLAQHVTILNDLEPQNKGFYWIFLQF